MSDDTGKPDDWGGAHASSSDVPEAAQESAQAGMPSGAPRVGFCQDCGKPLTPETLRSVGTGVFCEPCLTTRVGSTAPSSGYTAVPPYAPVPPLPGTTSDPSPVLAGFLGLIPGVGAMYNGQFAKGIAHLVIFAVLLSLSDNVNGIFSLFVVGWVFYMAFEAYHTAVARRDGLPLPNAFGLNDIGERMGLGKTWGSVKPAAAAPPQPPYKAPQASEPVTAAPPYVPVNPVPVGTAPDWVGYVPPTAFSGHAAPQGSMGAQVQGQGTRIPSYGQAGYTETFSGASAAYTPPIPPPSPAPLPEVPARRFPSGAIWLIALGILILLANLLPDWKLTAQWWAPLFLAGLSIWLFTRRLKAGARIVCIIRWPVILMVLAVLLALHAAYVPVTIGLSASVLLIALGALLLLERTAGALSEPLPSTSLYPDTPYPNTPGQPPVEFPQRAAWSAPPDTPYPPKDGQ